MHYYYYYYYYYYSIKRHETLVLVLVLQIQTPDETDNHPRTSKHKNAELTKHQEETSVIDSCGINWREISKDGRDQ